MNPQHQLINVRKLLGVEIDSQSNLNDHLVRITKKRQSQGTCFG